MNIIKFIGKLVKFTNVGFFNTEEDFDKYSPAISNSPIISLDIRYSNLNQEGTSPINLFTFYDAKIVRQIEIINLVYLTTPDVCIMAPLQASIGTAVGSHVLVENPIDSINFDYLNYKVNSKKSTNCGVMRT